MTQHVDLAGLDHASRQVSAIRAALIAEHATVTRQVDDLLDARWAGLAADGFRTAWTQWYGGMAGVLSGLGLEAAAIALARTELAGTDQDRADAVAALRDRLGS